MFTVSQAAELIPILIQQITDASKRRETTRDLHLFSRDVMRALLCRSCTLSLRAVHAIQNGNIGMPVNDFKGVFEAFETAVEACVKLHVLAESDTSSNSFSAKFSREIMVLSLFGAISTDAHAVAGFSSPRRAKPSAISLARAIDCVYRHCQFLSLECTMCLRVGNDMCKLECGHRLCGDCAKAADRVCDGVISATPRKVLGQTMNPLTTCAIVCPDCSASRVKVPLDGPQKRLPLQFACLLRLRALKREADLVNFIHSSTSTAASDRAAGAEPSDALAALPRAAPHASVIRKRIQAIVDGGKDDLLNARSPFALPLLGHTMPLLVALLEACTAALEHAPDVCFVGDATVRAIFSYVNAPVIAAHHSGQKYFRATFPFRFFSHVFDIHSTCFHFR